MEIKLKGKTFNEKESYLIIKTVIDYVEEVKRPSDVPDYLEKHDVEEYDDYYILRNPEFNGRHFMINKV